MSRSLSPGACLLAGCLLLSGCAFSNHELPMEAHGQVPADSREQDHSLAVVVPFEDVRARQDRCGMNKNGYNIDTADVFCTQDPATWIALRLTDGLAEAGYSVEAVRAADGDTGGTVIEGELGRLFVEPKLNAFTVDTEADIKVRLQVTSDTGLEAERTFYIKGVTQSITVTSGTVSSAFEQAADETVAEMVTAIEDLVEQYPGIAQGGPS